MALIPRDPFRALHRRREDPFEDMFRELSRRWWEGEADVLEPAVEVGESDHDVTVKVAVPGVDKDKLTVSIADDVLTVRGEHRKEEEEKKKDLYRQEIRYGAFQRVVPLPAEVDSAKARADLKNGMLTVTAPKTAHPKAQQVKIDVR
jgi:HSP20 family protein